MFRIPFLRKPIDEQKQVEEIAKKYLQEHIDRLLMLQRREMLSTVVVAEPSNNVYEKLVTLEMAFKEAYMLNSTVASCVNMIADAVSQVALCVHEETSPGEYTPIKKMDHEINVVLKRPNKLQTWIDFSKVVAQHLLLCGNCLAHRRYTMLENKVEELVIFDYDDFDISQDRDKMVYTVRPVVLERSPGKYPKKKFTSDEIIHFRDHPDPKNYLVGIGRIQAAYRSIDVDSKIVAWWLETIKKGCRKDALIKFQHDLTDKQYKRVRNLVEEQISGFVAGRGFMILGRSAEVEFLNMSPAEMDFANAHKDGRKDICAIFRVPPVLLGLEDTQVYKSGVEARQQFWLDNVLVIVNNIAATLSAHLIPLYKTGTKGALDMMKHSVTYDPKNVDAIINQYFERVQAAAKLVEVGVPLNRAIDVTNLGISKIDGGDRSYISVNLVPADLMDQWISSKISAGNSSAGPAPKVSE